MLHLCNTTRQNALIPRADTGSDISLEAELLFLLLVTPQEKPAPVAVPSRPSPTCENDWLLGPPNIPATNQVHGAPRIQRRTM